MNFNKLSNLGCAWLAELFCVDAIQEEGRACEDDKSLGLDGFNLVFFKTCWNIIKGDLVAFCHISISSIFNSSNTCGFLKFCIFLSICISIIK